MKSPMGNLMKNVSIVLLVFLVVSGILILFKNPVEKSEKISINQLANEVNEGKVQEITVDAEKLSIVLNDGTRQETTKETESSLSETLINFGVESDRLKGVKITLKGESGTAFFISVFLPFILPFLFIALFIWFMLRQAQRGNSQALSFGLSRARMINPKDKRRRTTFKDVAGAKEAKEELMEVVEFLKSPQKFLQLGAKIPKGVLLLGSPGTGKTLIAKAVAGEANVPFFNISGSEFVEMFVGVGASRVRDLFKQAKKSAPAIVFIDEIDAVGRHRGAGLGGGHDEREQTLNQILVEMDGFDTDTNVIVVAATNRPDVLDPALLRPGRFDRRVTMALPDIDERDAILKIHSRNKPISKEVNLKKVAQRTSGFSGADISNLLNEAAILAARRGKKEIFMPEILEAVEKVLLGPERRSRRVIPEEKKIIAYHEGGHAIIGAMLPNADPVQKVSIVARGYAGGYTISAPEKDKTLHSKKYYLDELAVLLGGYVSEKLNTGDVTTGASNDLEHATKLARSMVTRFGMSDLGPRTFGRKEELVFLGREISEERDYSEKTAEDIDQKVSELIKGAYDKAEEVLKNKKKELESVVKVLLERETIEQDEFYQLIGLKAEKEDVILSETAG